MIEVTQADRDAAEGWSGYPNSHLAEHFARHRLASQAAAIEATIEAAEGEAWVLSEDDGFERVVSIADLRAISVEQIMKGMGE